MNRNQTQQYIYSTSRRATAIFPLECGLNLQKKTHCRAQQGIMFALDLPLLHSFHSAAVQHLVCKGSDTSAHKKTIHEAQCSWAGFTEFYQTDHTKKKFTEL